MPKLEFSERFANDLSKVESPRVFSEILAALDSIERFGAFGSANMPASIQKEYGSQVRRIPVYPFDLIYTFYSEENLCRVEALVHQRSVR